MAATVTTDKVFQTFLDGPEKTLWYGHSFTGNPLGAAVALETLHILEDDRLIETMQPKCEVFDRELRSLESFGWVRHVRRTGFIGAFNLANPNAQDSRADYLADAGWIFYDEARKRGALLRPLGNVMYFVLPLTIEISQIEELFQIVKDVLQAKLDRKSVV